MNWKNTLEKEYHAVEGSFIEQLNCHATWDQAAYEVLFIAMRDCCKVYQDEESIPCWISELFWRLDWWVKAKVEALFIGSSDYNFYRHNAVVNFNHLACSLFMKEKRRDDEYEPIARSANVNSGVNNG